MGIEARDLFHIYPSRNEGVAALRGLSLTVPNGQICVLRGPNGSGKSTLVEILAGALRPSAGQVAIAGELRIVRQTGNTLSELTAREFLRLASPSPDEVLTEWDLEQYRNRRLSAISPGIRQLLATAAALAASPGVLLADEPAGALSRDESRTLYSHMTAGCRARGTTLLLVTHDLAAEAFADQVVRIRDGRVSELWEPGGAERTVIDRHGWLRLPAEFANRAPGTAQVRASGVDLILQGLPMSAEQAQFAQATPDMHDVLLTAKNLTTGYDEVAVLDGVSLSATRGSVTAVVGPSGSGKSTLLRTIAGLHPSWRGELSQTGELQLIADPVLVTLSLREAGASLEWTNKLGLAEMANRPMRELSGGQRQKAQLALALSSTADILLLDEPTSALDEDNRDLVDAILRNQPGRAIVVATHDPELAARADALVDLS